MRSLDPLLTLIFLSVLIYYAKFLVRKSGFFEMRAERRAAKQARAAAAPSVALQAWAAQGGWQVQDGADPIVAEETRYFLEMAAEIGPFEIGFVLSRPAGEGTTRLVQFWQQNGTEGPRVLAVASAQRFERAAGVLTPALADSLTRKLTASPRQLAA